MRSVRRFSPLYTVPEQQPLDQSTSAEIHNMQVEAKGLKLIGHATLVAINGTNILVP